MTLYVSIETLKFLPSWRSSLTVRFLRRWAAHIGILINIAWFIGIIIFRWIIKTCILETLQFSRVLRALTDFLLAAATADVEGKGRRSAMAMTLSTFSLSFRFLLSFFFCNVLSTSELTALDGPGIDFFSSTAGSRSMSTNVVLLSFFLVQKNSTFDHRCLLWKKIEPIKKKNYILRISRSDLILKCYKSSSLRVSLRTKRACMIA